MKKYLFLIAITLGVTVATTSCGGDKKTTEEAASNEATEKNTSTEAIVEVAEDNTLKPPFTITAVREDHYDNYDDTRKTVTITFKENGMYEGVEVFEKLEKGTDVWTPNDQIKDKTISGKWTTNHREVGENYQKVYVISSDGDIGYFVPEDGEYMYYVWEACSNFYKDSKYQGYEVKEVKQL